MTEFSWVFKASGVMSPVSVFSSFTKPETTPDTTIPSFSANSREKKDGAEIRKLSLEF